MQLTNISTNPGAESLQIPRSNDITDPELLSLLCAASAQENTTPSLHVPAALLINTLAYTGHVYFEPFFHIQVLGQKTLRKKSRSLGKFSTTYILM